MDDFFRGEKNKRRFRRIALNRPAEIVINAIDVYQGHIVNISPGDVALKCKSTVLIGDTAVIYVRDIDILPGRIIRHLPDGFVLSLMLSKTHQEKLTEKLFTQTNSGYQDTIDERRATPRHKKRDERSICRLADGSALFVKVIDISVTGAAVDAARKPEVGTTIRLAQRNGVVIRHTPRGFAISFDLVSFSSNRKQTNEGYDEPVLRRQDKQSRVRKV